MKRYSKDTRIFWSFGAARKKGLLSRSRWRQQNLIVPEDMIPAGVVVRESGKVRKDHGLLERPAIEDQGTHLIVAFDWYDVFAQDQTSPKKTAFSIATSQSESEKLQDSIQVSLMTEKPSEPQTVKPLASINFGSRLLKVNNVRAYVPETLRLPDACPVKEEIWWFLGMIYWKHLEQRAPWDKPINLFHDHLKTNIPHWPEVWKWCDRLRLVERTAGYTPGKRSYGYWTALPYREQTHRIRTFGHKLLAKRLRAIEKMHQNRPILLHLRKQLDRLSVDMDGFDQRFGNSPNRHYYQAHLQTILDGELRLSKDDFSGRVHTNISNMYKPLRSLLRVDGEVDALGETDIMNSQPLFLGLAAREVGIDDRRYLELCEAGEIYDHLAHRLGVMREAAKLEMVTFLYAKNGYRSTAKAVFAREFPKMTEYINRVKETDYKRLARRMQEAERKFVIDGVCVRLMRLRNDMFVTTIHDALLARKPDCDLIVSVMTEEFRRRGVCPRLEWRDVSQHSQTSTK